MRNSSAGVRLAARDLWKQYGSVQALKGASLEVAAGEVMGLVGENGAGKSTLVKILCGVVKADAGSVRVDDRAVELGTPRRASSAGIAVVQQELSVVGALSIAENVLLGSRSSRSRGGRGSPATIVRPFLELVGLAELDPALPAERLSVPERQLVEIARAVARNARIVLLDEPTAALSDDDIQRVRAVVARLSQEGRSVVYITHRLGEIFDMTQRVTVLRDGESQPPVRVSTITTGQLIEQMLGRPLDELFPARSSNIGDVVLDVDGLRSDGLVSPVMLNVRAGEILGLAGQLGSGAASVLRTLGGAQPIHAGRVVLGRSLCRLGSPRRAQHEGLAYCSGDRKLDGFFAGRSVEENLSSTALRFVTPRGWVDRGRERQLAADLADVVQFDQRRLQHSMSTLSGGNQQKIVLGKWLGVRPRVLLVEEPTRGVDVGARAEIYRHLRRFAADGLAIIFASSDTLEVQGLADRALTFFRGRQVGEYQAAAVDQPQLVRDITHPLERVG